MMVLQILHLNLQRLRSHPKKFSWPSTESLQITSCFGTSEDDALVPGMGGPSFEKLGEFARVVAGEAETN
jgi:hypothetical protein